VNTRDETSFSYFHAVISKSKRVDAQEIYVQEMCHTVGEWTKVWRVAMAIRCIHWAIPIRIIGFLAVLWPDKQI
jgi:hypothetical protein